MESKLKIMNPTLNQSEKNILSSAMYECYVQARREGNSHEDCVKHLGMPDSFRKRYDDYVVERLSKAFFSEEENEEEEN